jgi:hypothetical protein
VSKLVDLKLTKKEKKESAPCAVSGMPDYPWGTRLSLNDEALDKLGMKTLPRVGDKVSVTGVGVITSVSQHESEKRDDRCVEIQIQQLAVNAGGKLDDKLESSIRAGVRKARGKA